MRGRPSVSDKRRSGRSSERERFYAEKERIGEQYGLALGGVETWEKLRAWERWGEPEREARLGEATERGGPVWGDEEYRKEWTRQKYECGIYDEQQYRTIVRDEQLGLDYRNLTEDLHFVEVGADPDVLHEPDGHAPQKDQAKVREWGSRRRELERELDGLKREADRGERELTRQESELIGVLARLREAEREAREFRPWEDEGRDREPPGGGPVRPGGPGDSGPSSGGAEAGGRESEQERLEREVNERRERLAELRRRELEREPDRDGREMER